MSQTTFTEQTSADHHHGTLFDLLQQRLENHDTVRNNNNPLNETDAITQFSNQFEKLHQKRRKISHGDLAPTPSNSPAIHQHLFTFNSSRSYSHIPTPLLLNSHKIKAFTKTPPVTPDSAHKTPNVTPRKSNSSSSIRDRFPSCPLYEDRPSPPVRKQSASASTSSNSLLLSPDVGSMVITDPSHIHQPSMLSLSDKCIQSIEYDGGYERKYDEVMSVNTMPHHLYNVNDNDNEYNMKKLRSLSCSEAIVIKKTKVMSPRVTKVPNSPVLKPISDGIRRFSFDDPTQLKLPASPRSPMFTSRKNSIINSKDDDEYNDGGLELRSHSDIIMDE